MVEKVLPLERRLDILAGTLKRARKYGTGLIIFVVYQAEPSRAGVERNILARLESMGQRVRRVQFQPGEPPEAADLLGRLQAEPPAEDEVIFVYDLRHAFPGLLNSLNYRREFVPEGRWRLLFWTLEEEIIRVMREAPDFWAFVNQTVELPEIPSAAERVDLAGRLAWADLEWDREFRRLSSDERRARIALRERLLADLPADESSRAARLELHYTLGGLYYFDRLLNSSKQHFRIALDLARDEQNTAYQTHALNGLGNVYHDLDRHEEAIKAFQQAIELNPNDAFHYNELGNVYHDLGRHKEAIKAFQQAIKLDPNYAHPYNNLGLVYNDLGRHAEAVKAYRQAIELSPDDAYPHNGLGSVYQALGRHEEAIKAFQQAIELDPNFAYHYNSLGNIYQSLGRHEKAIKIYQQAIERDPKTSSYRNNLGNVYRALGRYEEAIKAFQQAIERDPDDAYPRYGLANVYRDLDCREEAVEAFQQAIKRDFEIAPPPHTMLGALYELEGRLENALKEHQQAVQLQPDSGMSLASLASVLRKLGREEEAANHLARARELMINEDAYGKACIEAISGNPEAALDHLAEALAQASGYRLWARRDPDLAALRGLPRFEALVGQADGPEERNEA